MDELIIRSLQGRTTPEQEEELLRWRAASPEHEARYRATAEVWQKTAVAEPGHPRAPVPTLADLERRARAGRFGRRRSGPSRPLAWAAVILLSLGLGFWGGVGWGPPVEQVATPRTEIITAEGEMATAVLPDGSVIRVAPRTRVVAGVSPHERSVRVDGRAFLSVIPDDARPMRVRSPGGEATVRGTRFEVDARDPSALRLLVVEGLVSLHAPDGDADVRAGQRGTATADAPPRIENVADPEAHLGWMGSFVAFESTPLSRVAREMELRLGVPIRILDPALADRTVTGSYTEQDMGLVLQSVCRAAAVQCRVERDTVFILSPEEGQP